MKYNLSALSYIDNNPKLEYLKEISQGEKIKIENSILVIDEINHLMDIFIIHKNNYQEIINFYKSVQYEIDIELQEMVQKGDENYKYWKIEINRLVNNYLSSFRMFVDHCSINIGKSFGKESTELNKFTELTNRAYDNVFAYRFIYKLRNYCQHCGLAVSGFFLSNEGFGFNFNKQVLLINYDSWGKVVKNDLEKGPESFDTLKTIEDHYNIITELSKKTHLLYETKFDQAIKHLEQLTSNYKQHAELVIVEDYESVEPQMQITIKRLPMNLINMNNKDYS